MSRATPSPPRRRGSPARTLPPDSPPAGLRLLELGQRIAGPFAARTLADFGAGVTKIEPPGAGDALRQWRLLKVGTPVWWRVQVRSKRSVVLDLKQAAAQDAVRRLADERDSRTISGEWPPHLAHLPHHP